MNDPAVLFYTSDFLTGVMDMTMEERGQYITLLCYQHQKGHIEEKTIWLLVGSCSERVMSHFKTDNDGLYYNERMDLEKEKRCVYTESRRKNGRLGGRPKSKKEENQKNHMDNHKDNHMGNHMGNDNENDNINININKNIKVIDSILYNLYDLVEQNFGRTLSPIEMEEIGTWDDNELTRYAIKQAILNGKYNLKYISRILDNYKKNGIITIQQAQADEENFKNKKEEEKAKKKLSARELRDLQFQKSLESGYFDDVLKDEEENK